MLIVDNAEWVVIAQALMRMTSANTAPPSAETLAAAQRAYDSCSRRL
jgi:hypothetical protein